MELGDLSAGRYLLPPWLNLEPINKFKPMLTVQRSYNTQITLKRLSLLSLTVLPLLSRMPPVGSLKLGIQKPIKQESTTETVRLRLNGSMVPNFG